MTKLDFYKTPDADFLDGLLHRTEDELNRFENSDLIEVTPTGKVNAYGYPIKNYKVKWNRSQKSGMEPLRKETQMIVREYFRTRTDGVKLYRTYSDANKYLIQTDTGDIYEDAIDVEDTPHTYEEGDDIPTENITTEEYAQVGRILMGGTR